MRILLIGGGTLGPVTPLLALAEELQREFQIVNLKSQILFWGTRRGPERALVEAAGILFRTIPAGKLRRYWDIRNLIDLVVVKWAFWVAIARLLRQRPSVVVGAGSFVQVPVIWAAWVLHIPIVIHQQDAQPGLANRLVAPFASRITAVFPSSVHAFGRKRVAVIGNPIRRSVLDAARIAPAAARQRFHLAPDRPTLLVIGGGTGAQALNERITSALPKLLEYANVIHVTGKGRIPNLKSQISNYRSFELLTDDLPDAYAAADLVISRAGMGTITELAVLEKPMVLIPMPDTHQEANAAALAAAGAAVVWDQRACTSAELLPRITALLQNEQQRRQLATAAATMFPRDAAARLAAMVVAVAQR